MCDFLMGSILKQWHSFPDPNHSKMSSSGDCEAWRLPSPSWIPVLSLECFLFPCRSRHGRPPVVSKYSFLLMNRKRTTRRTRKTPTADKKLMASGGTGKRTQRKRYHQVNQLFVLTTDQSYLESFHLLTRVADTLQVLTCWHPQNCVQGKGKGLLPGTSCQAGS